jgi:hypothetical protein
MGKPLQTDKGPTLKSGKVSSYAAIRPDAFEPLPGLALCDSSVCIEDLDAYVAYARREIAAGVPPDAEYRIIETK